MPSYKNDSQVLWRERIEKCLTSVRATYLPKRAGLQLAKQLISAILLNSSAITGEHKKFRLKVLGTHAFQTATAPLLLFLPNGFKIARSMLTSNTTFLYRYWISRREKLLRGWLMCRKWISLLSVRLLYYRKYY